MKILGQKIYVLLGVFILGIAVGAWGLAWIKFNVINAPKNQTTSTSESLVAGLKTYRNEQYGFELKSPTAFDEKPWTIEESSDKEIQDRINFYQENPKYPSSLVKLVSWANQLPSGVVYPDKIINVSISKEMLDDKFIAKEYQTYYQDNWNITIKDKIVNGLPFKEILARIDDKTQRPTEGPAYERRDFYTTLRDDQFKTIAISLTTFEAEENSALSAIQDKIINSFQLLK